MKSTVALLALLTIGVLALPARPSETALDHEQPLKSLLDDFMQGASSNDRAMHQRFWADELVYTSSSGERFGKQHILDGLTAAADSTEAIVQYRATAVNIRLLSDNIAVITFVLIADLPDHSQQRYLNSGVFQRQNDAWRAIVWQATKAAAEPVASD